MLVPPGAPKSPVTVVSVGKTFAPRTISAPVLWSALVGVCAGLATVCISVLTVRSYNRDGHLSSISEMLVNTPDNERALDASGIVCAVLGLLVSFTGNYIPPTPTGGLSLFQQLGLTRTTIGKLQYCSFCLAIGGVQVVVTCTYRMLLPLHFTAGTPTPNPSTHPHGPRASLTHTLLPRRCSRLLLL